MNLLGSFKNTLLIILAILTLLGLSIKNVRGSSDVTTISVNPLLSFASVGEHFNISLTIMNAVNVYSWQINMTFDPTVVSVVDITLPADNFLEGRPEGTTGILMAEYTGSVLFMNCILGNYSGMDGSGTLATVEFEVVATGISVLKIDRGEPCRTVLLDPNIQPTYPGPNLKTEDGFLTTHDPYWLVELSDLYEQLLDSYAQLLANYNTLLDEYQDLLSKCDDLESHLMSLNTTYISLLDDYTQLQTDYDSLQSEYDNLSDNYNSLETAYLSLNSIYNYLKADKDDLKSQYETNTSELGTARSLSYIFLITTIVFIATTGYYAVRKPRAKPVS